MRTPARLAPLLMFASLAGMINPLSAQTVTVGTADPGGNCIPFGCPNSFFIARYQQVYAAAVFSGLGGPISINAVTFFNDVDLAAAQFGDATYSIFFATTTASVNGLSTDLSANVGSTEQAFATLTRNGELIGSQFTINGSAYTYDPSTASNLLMDIFVSAVQGNQIHGGSVEADQSSSVTSRAYESGDGFSAAAPIGLVTQFTYDVLPVTSTPEPATLTLTATGLLGLAGWYRRGRRALA